MSRRIRESDAALVAIDFQERFQGAVTGFDGAAERAAILISSFRALGLPVVVTEQYPRGLGPTVSRVAEAVGDLEAIEKTVFSAALAPGFELGSRSSIVVCGVEAHVCVAQTVLDLLDRGLDVFIAADAVASRNEFDRDVALSRLAAAGAVVTTTEAVAFELLGGAEHSCFRTVQGLIK